MRRLITVIASTWVALAAAQAPATPTPVDQGLILDLLGTGQAMEVELPPEVDQVLLYGIRGGELLLEQDKRVTSEARGRRGGTINVKASAGGLNGGGSCSVLGFARLALLDAEGEEYTVGTSRHCLHEDPSYAIRGGNQPIPLKLHSGTFDLPLDTWLPLEAVWLWANGEPVGSHLDTDSFLIFYLYLSSEGESTPELPSYSNWDELRSAYQPEASD